MKHYVIEALTNLIVIYWPQNILAIDFGKFISRFVQVGKIANNARTIYSTILARSVEFCARGPLEARAPIYFTGLWYSAVHIYRKILNYNGILNENGWAFSPLMISKEGFMVEKSRLLWCRPEIIIEKRYIFFF